MNFRGLDSPRERTIARRKRGGEVGGSFQVATSGSEQSTVVESSTPTTYEAKKKGCSPLLITIVSTVGLGVVVLCADTTALVRNPIDGGGQFSKSIGKWVMDQIDRIEEMGTNK